MLLPERNKKDFEDVPEAARKAVRFVWLATVDDAIEAALEPVPQAETLVASDEQRRAPAAETDLGPLPSGYAPQRAIQGGCL